MALRGVGPESEAESVHFQGRRVTKVSPGVNSGLQFSISNSQQVLPLAKFAFEPHALGDLKRRDDATLDLLAGLSGALAS